MYPQVYFHCCMFCIALWSLSVCRRLFSIFLYFLTASFLPFLPYPSSLPYPSTLPLLRTEIKFIMDLGFFFLSFLSHTRCCMSYCFHLTECWSKYLQEQTNMSLQRWVLVCCSITFIYCDSTSKWRSCFYRICNCKMTVHTEEKKSVNKLNSNELTCRKSILP